MKKIFLTLSTILLLMACKTSEPTKVMVLSTIHAAHQKNLQYSYEDLFEIIKNYNPDIIGVEIRPEDIHQEEDYLKNFYPQEMRMVLDSFPEKTVGLDFYGSELKDKLIPTDVFKDPETEIGNYVVLMRKLAVDSVYNQQKEALGLHNILEAQQKMALEDSAEDFMNGTYDSITRVYYNRLDEILKNTAYEPVAAFDRQRDIAITKNALKLIDQNPEKKILILVGANHRGRIVDSLQNKKINLITKLNFQK